MANPLDWAARAILQINGMKPEEIKAKARQLKAGKGKKPMPKANTTRSAVRPTTKPPVRPPNSAAQGRDLIKEGAQSLKKPKPPARPKPGSTQVKGQTNLFNAKGNPRDFRNPKVSANRPPTTTPVKHEPPKQLNPKPQRPAAPGQGSLFGENPKAKPGGNYKAPSVPKAGSATKPPAAKPTASQQANEKWVKQNSKASREKLAKIGDVTSKVRPVSTPGTIAALATSNFGNEGEKPDVRARRLGFKDAADQKAKIAAQKRSNTTRTPEQAIKDSKAQSTRTAPASKPDTSKSGKSTSTANYQRPKANVSKPTAARKAAQERDYKKLKDFG